MEKAYNYKCRVGNWYEDYTTNIMKDADFEKQKESKNLLRDQQEKKIQLQTTSILLLGEENCLKVGDVISLKNMKTSGLLSVDLNDRSFGPEEPAVTTSTIYDEATSRNGFIILAQNKSTGSNICYGDKIMLQTHTELSEKPYYLISYNKTPIYRSKKSKNQPVVLNSTLNNQCLWFAEYFESSYRLELEGEPISKDHPIILKHSNTNSALASHFYDYFNDFGSEYEVCCCNYVEKGKKSCLQREHSGCDTIDTLTRQNSEENLWMVI